MGKDDTAPTPANPAGKGEVKIKRKEIKIKKEKNAGTGGIIEYKLSAHKVTIFFGIVMVSSLSVITGFQIKIWNDLRLSRQYVDEMSADLMTYGREQIMFQLGYEHLAGEFPPEKRTCDDDNGQFSFTFKRCYVYFDSSSSGRTYSKQKEQCESNGGVLAYPRSRQELIFLSDFYSASSGLRDDYTFRVGFAKLRGSKASYESADGKFTVDIDSNWWKLAQTNEEYEDADSACIEKGGYASGSIDLVVCSKGHSYKGFICATELDIPDRDPITP